MGSEMCIRDRYLQNVIPTGSTAAQELMVTIALSERILAGSRGEIPAEARLARLWVDGPAPGDVMCPLGMSGRSKKVSDLLGEARIPVSERAGVPVVRTAPGGAVVWVAGVRADERFKCTAATRVAYLLRVVDAD